LTSLRSIPIVRMNFDYVITVCDHAKEICPVFPGGQNFIHQGFEDPARFEGSEEQTLAGVRYVHDEIRHWIQKTFGAAG